jgi:hypothetical protein
VVNANCSQNDACEQTMGNLIHKTHHGLDLGQMHHSPSYNIYLYLTMGLHESGKRNPKNIKREFQNFQFVKLWLLHLYGVVIFI